MSEHNQHTAGHPEHVAAVVAEVVITPTAPVAEGGMNPAQAAAVASIKANYDAFVEKKTFKFHFKKDDLGNKRPTVELELPVPSVQGIIDILTKENNEKELSLLLEAIENVVTTQARSVVNSDENITQDSFPVSNVLWGFIANMEKAERRGGGISKETWDEFAKDYTEVMPAVTGKTADQVGRAAAIFIDKFNKVKTNKPVLTKLKEQLGIYITSSPRAEDYQDCVEFLTDKATKLLAQDDSALLDNL